MTAGREASGGVGVAVVGAGSWGTAIAHLLASKGHEVRLWSFESPVVEEVRSFGENRSYLPGIPLDEGLRPTADLDEAIRGASVVVSVSPAQHVRGVMTAAARSLAPYAVVVSASKGIEIERGMRMDEVLADVLPGMGPERFAVLSGPSFAREVALGMPTAVVAASESEELAVRIQTLFQTERFRVYTNRDVVGVELGGAVKNVIALAAGVSAGLGFGHNTLAALITRGLAEISRLGEAQGASPATFAGLAGMGDLVLTCTGDLSRNRMVGIRLGQGEKLGAILEDMRMVAEGVRTAPAVRALARRHGVEMPIVEQVCALLEGACTAREALERLMMRPPRAEG